MKQVKLINLIFSNPVKKSDLNTKLATLATKTGLKAKQDEIVKLQAFHSSFFHGKNHFEYDGMHSYLVIQKI